MLTRPLTLTESEDRGRGLAAMSPPPALPLADEAHDEETQTGVFSPPAPPWSSSSSPSSPPPSPACSSSPPFPPSLLPRPPPAPFMSPPPVAHLFLPPPSSSAPPAPPSFHPSPSFVLPPNSVHFPPVSASFSPPPPPPPAPPHLYHRSSCHVSPPVPPPVFFTPFTSTISSPLSSSPPVAPSLPSPPPVSPPAVSPPVVSPPAISPHLPAAPPPLCCPCSSLLPRLLSAHRLEVRRLLRGALASLGRRLDSLERRSRRRRRMEKRSRVTTEEEEGSAFSSGSGAVPGSPAPSGSPAHRPSVTCSSSSSSSSDDEDSPPSFSVSQSEQSRRGRKRRRKNHRRREMSIFPKNREAEEEEEEEEEDAGRFVGRMAFSFRGGGGAEEEAPLVLHKFNHRKHRRRECVETGQSEKAVSIVRQNGYRAQPLHGFSSQNALQLEPLARSQSEALAVSSGQWRFCDVPFSTNHSAFHIWHLSSVPSSFSPSPMLRLSAVAVETLSGAVRGGACWRPLRRLKDWTAPPSLSSDHCYVRTPAPSFSARRQQKQRANHSSRSLHLPRRRPLPLPLCSTNRLSALLAVSQSAEGSEFLSPNGERGKRVSQIRIRRASPRETPLTPMGLPKVKRLKKKEFSLEEIYTNKNYKSPTTNRSLETIFEEPREKDGALLLIGQQRRRRLLLFPDFTQPRKRKRPQGAGLPVGMVPRKRAAARRHCHGDGSDDSDLDVMLVERLSALEDFLTRQGLDA